jgi:putative DNA primase/helicase
VDRYPDSDARAAAWGIFHRLDAIQPDAVRAESDGYEPIPFLRFDEEAQSVFAEWHKQLETRLRSNELTPALKCRLAKYRKLVPSLALINHFVGRGIGPISESAMLRAMAFAEFLESHAKRAYGAGLEAETSAPKAILKQIRNGDLHDGCTGRDGHWPRWSNLSDRDHVQAGLDLLCDLNWLLPEKRETGGRPTFVYRINPRAVE